MLDTWHHFPEVEEKVREYLKQATGREFRIPKNLAHASDIVYNFRKEIEPWITALFQSEYLSLLTGAGLSSAAHILSTGTLGAGMSNIEFSDFKNQIELKSKESAQNSGRITANIEDQIRIANELIRGLEILIKFMLAEL